MQLPRRTPSSRSLRSLNLSMRTKLKIGIAFTFMVLPACAWLLYPTSPEIRIVRPRLPVPVGEVVQPIAFEKRRGVIEAVIGRFTSPAAVQVVGSLSQAAVEDIVNTVQSGKLLGAREKLFSGNFADAWFSYQLARRSTVEAIYEKEDGSVSVVSAVHWPDQPVIRHENAMRGWTANWKGTKEADEVSTQGEIRRP